MKAIKFFIAAFCLLISIGELAAFQANVNRLGQDTILPKVFLIGEYESQYEEALTAHGTFLLTACDYDMDAAYDKWMSMLREMEAYANSIKFDLKGVKLWINVFWNPDGSVEHIAYHLKPISRNIDTLELNAFFSSFMNNYKFPLVLKEKYSHHGSASFPLFPVRIPVGVSQGDQKKKG